MKSSAFFEAIISQSHVLWGARSLLSLDLI